MASETSTRWRSILEEGMSFVMHFPAGKTPLVVARSPHSVQEHTECLGTANAQRSSLEKEIQHSKTWIGTRVGSSEENPVDVVVPDIVRSGL